jgi:hypothetical protein
MKTWENRFFARNKKSEVEFKGAYFFDIEGVGGFRMPPKFYQLFQRYRRLNQDPKMREIGVGQIVLTFFERRRSIIFSRCRLKLLALRSLRRR